MFDIVLQELWSEETPFPRYFRFFVTYKEKNYDNMIIYQLTSRLSNLVYESVSQSLQLKIFRETLFDIAHLTFAIPDSL